MFAKQTVLYADDDVDDILLLEEVFKPYAEKIDLITFNNGVELLSYLKQLPASGITPCLIILDINMPLLNGKDTLVALREMERYNEIPVIMFTTSSHNWDKQFAFKYNAGFFTKPVNIRQLETVANIFIDHCADDIKEQIRRSATNA